MTGLLATRLPTALHLPRPDQSFMCCRDIAEHAESHPAGPQLRSHECAGVPPAPDDEQELARYRWILGHQLAVSVWRLLCENLGVGDPVPVVLLYDAYSAAVLYAGSCSPRTYDQTIRPWMRATSPAFSGTWARDYHRVTALLRESTVRHDGAVRAAIKRNAAVHMAVGRRLVPSGRSLFAQSGRDARAVPTERELDLFDRFFGTDHRPTCRADFADQVWARVTATLADISQTAPDAPESEPAVDIRTRMPALLCGVAVLAAAFAVEPR